jgi:putative glutamine amidotransferase
VAEIELAHQAVERALPVLGICRGCQVLNVALGGTLVQHLPDVTTQAHLLAEQRGVPVHEVEIADDSLLRKLAGVRRLEVNRIHHQAVERPAPGLRPVAWAGDRTIEALELSGRPVLGIQWRPENLLDDPRQRALWLVAGAVRVPDTADPASTDAAQSPGAPRG